MKTLKTIVITGSNQGLGYAIAENLASKKGWNIILTSIDFKKGIDAQKQILTKFPKTQIHVETLDITSKESINMFLQQIKHKYNNYIDVLINNAAVSVRDQSSSSVDIFDYTFQPNFYGTIDFTEKILPFIKNKGKIIFIGSDSGKLSRLNSEDLKQRFRNQNISKQQLYQLMQQYRTAVLEKNYEQKGWPRWIYAVSKLGINHYVKILTKYPEIKRRQLQVYNLCPNYMNTDMTRHLNIKRTPQQGALTPVYLAELPFEINNEFQGQFFQRCKLSSLQ